MELEKMGNFPPELLQLGNDLGLSTCTDKSQPTMREGRETLEQEEKTSLIEEYSLRTTCISAHHQLPGSMPTLPTPRPLTHSHPGLDLCSHSAWRTRSPFLAKGQQRLP